MAVQEIISPEKWDHAHSLASSVAYDGTNSLAASQISVSGKRSQKRQRNLFAVKNLVKQGGSIVSKSVAKTPKNPGNWEESSQNRLA